MTQDSNGLSGQRLNFVIAVSAILISAASFYATYLQADAAEKQVRAMTLPLIQFEHGNYDTGADQAAISFTLKNAGVGPAVIRSVNFQYNDRSYASTNEFIQACCDATFKDYIKQSKAMPDLTVAQGASINSVLVNSILPGQSDRTFFQLFKSDLSAELWEDLNHERWKLKLNICFCSLLEDCYTAEDGSVINEVKACPATN